MEKYKGCFNIYIMIGMELREGKWIISDINKYNKSFVTWKQRIGL